MKTSRFISLLLCVVMIMSLFTGLAGSASADDVITHEVQSGEILMKICEKYGLNYYNSKNAIMQLNGFTSETQLARLSVGQKLKLPASNAVAGTVSTTTATVTTTTVGGTTLTTTSYAAGTATGGSVAFYLVPYTVKAGDTLNKICNEVGSNYYFYSPVIQGINALANPNQIKPGQVLLIPTASPTGASSAVVGHVVKAGETITSIANQYGLNYQAQRQLINGLNRRDNMDKIYVGQTVLIPATAAAAGSSVVTTTTGTPVAATTATSGNFQISISGTTNGSPYAVVNNTQFVTQANAGETVNIVPSPKAGYAVRDIQVIRTDSGADIPVLNYAFTMPNSSVQVTVYYSRGYIINKVASPYGTFDTMIYGTNANAAFFGDEVALAIYPKSGYNVKIENGVYYQRSDLSMERVYVQKDESDGLYKFKMPNYEIRLTVEFQISEYYSLFSSVPNGGGRVEFYVDGVKTIRALEGQTVTMKMVPNNGWVFNNTDYENPSGTGLPEAQFYVKDHIITKLSATTYRFVMSNKNATSGKVVFTNNNSYELKSDIRGGHGKVSYQIVDSNYNILKKDVHSAQPGNLVELIFQPDNEWAFDPGDFTFMQNNSKLNGTGYQLNPGSWTVFSNRYFFQMPSDSVTIVSKFQKTGEIYYDLKLEYDANLGTVWAVQDDGRSVTRAKAGQQVTIYVTANDNYRVTGMNVRFKENPNGAVIGVPGDPSQKTWSGSFTKHADRDTIRVYFEQYNEYTTVGDNQYTINSHTSTPSLSDSKVSMVNVPVGSNIKMGTSFTFSTSAANGYSVSEVWLKRDGTFVKMLAPDKEGGNTYSYTVSTADKGKMIQFLAVRTGEEPVHYVIPEYTIADTGITNVGNEPLYYISVNGGPDQPIGPKYGMGAGIYVSDNDIKSDLGAKIKITIPKDVHKYLGADMVLLYQVDTLTIRLSDYVLDNYKVLEDGSTNFVYEFWYKADEPLTDLNIMVNFKEIGTSDDTTTDSGAVTGTPIYVTIDGVTYQITSGEGTIITTPDKDATITIIGKVA